MFYFDCHCELGPRVDKDPAAPWSTEDVLRGMDRCGIAAALVVHTLSVKCDPVHARATLADEIARAPGRFVPVWVVMPPDAGDCESTPDELLGAMDAADVRAVKLCPAAHNWPLSLSVIGPTLEALQARSALTMLDYAEAGPTPTACYEKLDEVLGAFPKLPLLMLGQSWGMQRAVTALMTRHENLHIEFSSYQINRGIEEYTRRFGAERLLFGTNMPAKAPGAARAYVDYARVSDEAKEKIAGGNLARLLGGPRTWAETAPESDSLLDRAALGRPLDGIPVLDAHCHILREGADSEGAYVMYRGDADGLVEIKDTMGVDKTAVMSWTGPIGSDPIESNDVVARAVERHPDRFLGVCYVNPVLLDAEAFMAEVRRRVEEQGFVGFKPYPRVGLRYDDPLYAPCWQYMNERGLYALVHTGGVAGDMGMIDALAQQYPDAQWAVAHSGGSFAMARSVVGVMKERPNVWAELTLTPVTNGVIEWMVSEVGDERILFGTDAPMRDPRPQFGWVVWADLPVESRRRILGGNFQRLLAMRKAK